MKIPSCNLQKKERNFSSAPSVERSAPIQPHSGLLGSIITEHMVKSVEIGISGEISNTESTDEGDTNLTWRYVQSPSQRSIHGRKEVNNSESPRTLVQSMDSTRRKVNNFLDLNSCNIAIIEHQEQNQMNNDSIQGAGIPIPTRKFISNRQDMVNEEIGTREYFSGSLEASYSSFKDREKKPAPRARTNSRSLSPGLRRLNQELHNNKAMVRLRPNTYASRMYRDRVNLAPQKFQEAQSASGSDSDEECCNFNLPQEEDISRDSLASGITDSMLTPRSPSNNLSTTTGELNSLIDGGISLSAVVDSVPSAHAVPLMGETDILVDSRSPMWQKPISKKKTNRRRRSSGSTSSLFSTGSNLEAGQRTPPSMPIQMALVNEQLIKSPVNNSEALGHTGVCTIPTVKQPIATSFFRERQVYDRERCMYIKKTSPSSNGNCETSDKPSDKKSSYVHPVITSTTQQSVNPYAPPFFGSSVDSTDALGVEDSMHFNHVSRQHNTGGMMVEAAASVEFDMNDMVNVNGEKKEKTSHQPAIDMMQHTEKRIKSVFRPISTTIRNMCPSTDNDDEWGYDSSMTKEPIQSLDEYEISGRPPLATATSATSEDVLDSDPYDSEDVGNFVYISDDAIEVPFGRGFTVPPLDLNLTSQGLEQCRVVAVALGHEPTVVANQANNEGVGAKTSLYDCSQGYRKTAMRFPPLGFPQAFPSVGGSPTLENPIRVDSEASPATVTGSGQNTRVTTPREVASRVLTPRAGAEMVGPMEIDLLSPQPCSHHFSGIMTKPNEEDPSAAPEYAPYSKDRRANQVWPLPPSLAVQSELVAGSKSLLEDSEADSQTAGEQLPPPALVTSGAMGGRPTDTSAPNSVREERYNKTETRSRDRTPADSARRMKPIRGSRAVSIDSISFMGEIEL